MGNPHHHTNPSICQRKGDYTFEVFATPQGWSPGRQQQRTALTSAQVDTHITRCTRRCVAAGRALVERSGELVQQRQTQQHGPGALDASSAST